MKNNTVTLRHLTEVPQAFTWNNEVIFPVFRYNPGVQCCPHIFDLYKSILLIIFLICAISFPSVSPCTSRISFRTTFFDGFQKWQHRQHWGVFGTHHSPDRSTATTGIPLAVPPTERTRENLGGMIPSKPVESGRRPWLLALGLPWRMCYLFICTETSIFFQPEWGLCLIRGNNKERTKCNFPWDTAVLPDSCVQYSD